MKTHSHGRFFAQLLSDPDSGPLRETVTQDIQGFINCFVLEDEGERWPATINAIHAAHSISQFPETEDWLVSHDDLRKSLLKSGRGLETNLRQNSLDPDLRLAAEQAGEHLMKVLTIYLSRDFQNLDFFFEVVDAVTCEELKPSPALFSFIYTYMISSKSVDYWRTLIMRCIDVYTQRHTSQKLKTFALYYIANPIFAMDVKRNWDNPSKGARGTELMDKSMTELIHNRLWRPQSLSDTSEETGQLGVDHSRMELLQMTTFLVKYHHILIQDSRKDVIKFGWNYIRLEDIINKHAAYVLIAYFIAHYDTPAKIAIQVYQALLKAHQNEGRALVMQALELLAPVLKKRIGGGDSKIPTWARIPRKILAEESANLQQLMSVCNFLVRHPDLFYEAREPFAKYIIPALPKIAQLPNPSTENKRLVLNLIHMIWVWEERCATESSDSISDWQSSSPSTLKRKRDGSPVSPSPKSVSRNFVAPAPLRMELLKYFTQFIAYLPERYPVASTKPKDNFPSHIPQPAHNPELCRKAIQLLYSLLSPPYWSDLEFETKFPEIVETHLTTDLKPEERPELWTTRIINALQIIKVFVNVKPDEWVLARLPQLQRLLEKPIRLENTDVQDCFHKTDNEEVGGSKMQPLLERILSVIPVATPDEDDAADDATPSDFIVFCSTVATEGQSSGHLISAINLLWTLSQRWPKEIDQQIPQLMRTLQSKLAKDHLAACTAMTGQAALRLSDGAAAPDPTEFEVQTDLILKVIGVLASRMSQLGDSRRPFLIILASLVERSTSNALCLKILDYVRSWIFDSTDSLPSLKEKTAVLQKMQLFEHRTDPTLLTRFLDLVIRIYEDPKVTRSELSVRMEHAFLIGTRAQDVDMRNRFMNICHRSLSSTASSRLNYVITSQNWDCLADSYWLSQVIQLMFGCIEKAGSAQLHSEDFRTAPASALFGTYAKDVRLSNIIVEDEYETFISAHKRFVSQLGEVLVGDITEPLSHLQHTDSNLAHEIWVAFFPLCWAALSKDDRAELEKGMVSLLTKDYHQRQIDKRPNCVQTLLEGIAHAKPRFRFPPQVMKFLARSSNAWYTAAHYLEGAAIHPIIDTAPVRESNLDALLEIYAGLQEDDLFYGTWRRRCQYVETNAALSYEQHGMWDKAQMMYEGAQIKARTGALPFPQGEYMLWEDHWVICAQKLQQWDILSDFAKHENFNDLYLESSWRNFEAWANAEQREQIDSIIKAVSDAPTPRRTFFQAFMSLLKLHAKTETTQDFNRYCDEAIQLSIRKWHQLPKRITNAHIPILQNFQQLVELHDASLICASLAQTTALNLDSKSQELKMLLTTWRDRMPNFWDDINAWQDLVTWRQHVFQLINGTYLHLVPAQQGNAPTNSYAYRGYHETAWLINRFAHVARKHNLPDVCISQLGRIYTLPNIEIQEAFLKLREQAKCHYQGRNEYSSGLDVINNTNLNYFGQQQKAEFYTLKGMFLAKLGQKVDANDAFGSALFFDIKLPKAWAEWGRYNDLLFKEEQSLEKAASAISCYLEAAGQYKSAKSRKLLSRVLWLLSLDDAQGTLAKAFTNFKGDFPIWYWITFIPQLLASLSRPEAPLARVILVKLAKAYPQALYFQLRTSREDMHAVKKQQEQKEVREKAARAKQGHGSPTTKHSSPDSRPPTANGSGSRPRTASGDIARIASDEPSATPKTESEQAPANDTPEDMTPKKPWDYLEEIMSALKTAFPLLALSMETMVDQIQKHFKCPPDEDAYRLTVALLNDGLSYVGRSTHNIGPDAKLPPSTEANILRFAESIMPHHIRRAFEADFVKQKPTTSEYIQRLRRWRDRLAERLDRRSPTKDLESYSAHLSEFRFQKFDEVEIPGQYLLHRDQNKDFVRIERFSPDVELVRGPITCHRRLKIRGHDGSLHPFAVQSPAARHCRREERILQLFRMFNVILSKRKESRRRNLQFHLPLMVPLSPNVRLAQDDPSYITLQGIYEDYCRRNGDNKDDPILFTMEKLRALNPVSNVAPTAPICANIALSKKNAEQVNAIRLESFAAIQEKFVPANIVLDYFNATHTSFSEFWLFRRTVSYNLAALTFMTYILYMNSRHPHKMSIARATGRVWGSELIPAMAGAKPYFHNPEPVPFRFTPNLQTLLGPLATEGIFAPSIMAIARCLTEPEGELELQLSLFVRDEMTFWYTQQQRQNTTDGQLRESVQINCEQIVRRAVSLAQPPTAGNLPANQTVVDLVAQAVNPIKLSQCDSVWMGYL